MVANIIEYWYIFAEAYFTSSLHPTVLVCWRLVIGNKTNFDEVLLTMIVIFFLQVIFVPFEFIEQEKAPTQIKANNVLYLLEDKR